MEALKICLVRNSGKNVLTTLNRSFSASSVSNKGKVAVLGASGGIGQPLSLLLKQSPLVSKLSLYDVQHTKGVGADLSHIETNCKVSAFVGAEQLHDALVGCDIVVIPAGVPRKPGMTRDDLFNMNATVVHGVAQAVAEHAPKALVCIITNPVNSTVPIFAEVMKAKGKYDPKRLFGVTTLDLVRARTFIHESKHVDADVPVIGGHSGPTIVPLLSHVYGNKWTPEELEQLTHRIQYAGDEVVNAKAGAGSATLSMAYAGYRFADALIEAKTGKKNVNEWAYVQCSLVPGVDFFANRLSLDADGVASIDKLPEMSKFEQEKFTACVDQLKKDIAKGVAFAKAM